MASLIHLGKCIFLRKYQTFIIRHSSALARATVITPSKAKFIPSCFLSSDTHNTRIQFRSLQPVNPQNVDPKIPHLSKLTKFNLINGFPRTFFFKKKNDDKNEPRKKRVPRLILIQNPLTWLMIKIDFSVLRHIWDPTFAETDFKFGTKQVNIHVCLLYFNEEYYIYLFRRFRKRL